LFLGEVTLPLDKINWSNPSDKWYALKESTRVGSILGYLSTLINIASLFTQQNKSLFHSVQLYTVHVTICVITHACKYG